MEAVIPLDVPEIRLLIGSYLENKHLLTCMQVCKTWRDSFLPLLYQTVTISGGTGAPTDLLIKYVDFIRYFTCPGHTIKPFQSIPCSTLISLIIGNYSYPPYKVNPLDPSNHSLPVPELILLNKNTLQYFTLKDATGASTVSLWDALYQCTSLVQVTVRNIGMDSICLAPFWRLCQNVSKLVVYKALFPPYHYGKTNFPMELEFPNLTSLHNTDAINRLNFPGASSPFLLHMIQRAPNLRSLQWKASERRQLTIESFQSIMTSTKFKNLQDLDLSAGNLDDQSTADVLNAMYEAKAFEIVSSEFSMHSFNSLITRHAPTIRKLGLHYCSQLTGEMVQGILTQCPSLEIFKANRIHGAVLVRIGQVDPSTYDVDAVTLGQDWVCPNLRWLVLSFESGGSTGIIDTKIPRSEREKLMELQRILAQKHVLRQLSRLTELRWLCFKFSEDYLYQTLNLKLKSRGGELDQLSTLKKLERIDLGSEPLDFTEGEIDWMGGNWPYIKTVNGVFNRDYDKNGELETYGNLFYGISTSERSNSFF